MNRGFLFAVVSDLNTHSHAAVGPWLMYTWSRCTLMSFGAISPAKLPFVLRVLPVVRLAAIHLPVDGPGRAGRPLQARQP
jgi:hypothetical protein